MVSTAFSATLINNLIPDAITSFCTAGEFESLYPLKSKTLNLKS